MFCLAELMESKSSVLQFKQVEASVWKKNWEKLQTLSTLQKNGVSMNFVNFLSREWIVWLNFHECVLSEEAYEPLKSA